MPSIRAYRLRGHEAHSGELVVDFLAVHAPHEDLELLASSLIIEDRASTANNGRSQSRTLLDEIV
jgi:hypothetical protein